MALLTSIAQGEIDAWPVEEAGLSRRATNCLVRAGIRTIGQLRKLKPHQLLGIRTLGRISLRDIQRFHEMTAELVRGGLRLPSVREIFRRFLNPTELTVIEQRFGLLGPPSDPTIERISLQAIGSQLRRTRERIRQCEETARARLCTRLVRAYLEPFVEKLERVIEEHDRFLTAEESLVLAHDADFEHYHPPGLLLLFAELYGKFHYHNGFFTTRPLPTLLALQQRLLDQLARATRPLSARDLLAQMRRGAEVAALGQGADREAALDRLLLQHPEVEVTAERAYFTASSILLGMLQDVVRQLGGEAHYREVTLRLNEQMHPTRQRGSGAVLKLLATSPEFRKTERARYALAEGRGPAVASRPVRS